MGFWANSSPEKPKPKAARPADPYEVVASNAYDPPKLGTFSLLQRHVNAKGHFLLISRALIFRSDICRVHEVIEKCSSLPLTLRTSLDLPR